MWLGFGWGVTITGRLPSPVWHERDNIMFQHNEGAGIGHYISDLSAKGEQDGVYDSVALDMRVPSAYSGDIGYEHWWSETIRSAFSFGIVNVKNLDIQLDDALHLTRRYTGNVIWSPIPRLDLGHGVPVGHPQFARVGTRWRAGCARLTACGGRREPPRR